MKFLFGFYDAQRSTPTKRLGKTAKGYHLVIGRVNELNMPVLSSWTIYQTNPVDASQIISMVIIAF